MPTPIRKRYRLKINPTVVVTAFQVWADCRVDTPRGIIPAKKGGWVVIADDWNVLPPEEFERQFEEIDE